MTARHFICGLCKQEFHAGNTEAEVNREFLESGMDSSSGLTSVCDQCYERIRHDMVYLAQRRCPDSGLPLDREYNPDAFGRHTVACAVCDCFGYDPNDPRLGHDGR